jgi:hypothetical protein
VVFLKGVDWLCTVFMSLRKLMLDWRFLGIFLSKCRYMFSITKFDPESKKPIKIIYGKNDKVRPWEFTKITYEGKIS